MADPKRTEAGRKSHETRRARAELERQRTLARKAMVAALNELEERRDAEAVTLMAIATIRLTRDVKVIRRVEVIVKGIREDWKNDRL